MSFANPAALWWLSLLVPVLALHVLRSRRTELTVSSTLAWQEHDRPVAAARPWQRLRWSLPLVLQLLAVALLALVMAGPSWDTGRSSAQHLVVLVDTSASMGATDGSPTRLADARSEVLDAVGELGTGARVSIIAAGAPATMVASEIPPSEVRSRLEALDVSEGSFDGEVASSLALSLDRPDRSTAYVLVTDGGVSGADVSLLPAGTETRTVGRRDTNLGVTNVVVSRAGDLLHVQATVTNGGGASMTTVVRVDVDGVTADSSSVEVPANGATEVGFDVAQGERIAVHLDSQDLLALDDHAHAVGPAARTAHVLRVGGDSLFLDALLSDREDVEVTHVATLAELPTSGATPYDAFDLVLFDRTPVVEAPPVPWFAIAPPGGAPGVTVDGQVDLPVPALVRHDDRLLEGLDLSELAVASSQKIDAPAATTVIGAEQTPLFVSGRVDAAPFVYLGFDLQESNLGLLAAFPVLGDRIIGSLAGTELSAGNLAVGDPLPVDLGLGAVVESPSGTRTEVPAGGVAPELDRSGIWTVTPTDGAVRHVVVNPPSTETAIAPRDGLAIPGAPGGLDGEGAAVLVSIAPWLIGLALAAAAAEWWATSRRRGVARRQWRVAQVARGAICLALLVALLAPSFERRTSSVAAVFVLDVSDSTAGSRAAAVEAVQTALEDVPDGDVAGVVVVGATARVDTAVAEELRWAGPRVRVDGSATDLASGVRIAGAVAPATHGRRIVLISDGRPTTGDLDAEIARLRRSGVRLDVIPVGAASGPDVLVSSVEVPDRARTTDVVQVRVRILATAAQPVTVVLHRDDVEVDRRLVDAPAGASEVVFEQPAGEPGTVRWTAIVAGPSNGVPQNDRGRAATRIEGRPQVLIVQGAPGEGDKLQQVLAATGAQVEVVDPEDLPDLAGLATTDAVVLVDVPASTLSAAQVNALSTATRDLGTGLVVVGGTASYGAGDYLGSRLEELLPVTSEVRDPKRRSKVAQVFAVDVSGSMGACHCAEDGGGENSRLGGGVEKTDIVREAAVLALDGISPTDELGVLALDDSHRWLLDLGPLGDGGEARRQLDGVRHAGSGAGAFEGGTNLEPSLTTSAERLRSSDASLRHIVLFTDGFEEPNTLSMLAEQAAQLRDEGITVSVMGTGEGSAVELRAIADAGGGRFYPGRDLRELPNLLLEETKVVSRQLIVEGEHLPEITSSAPIVETLDAAPPVLGYVATTARPTATQHLRVGEERDPLLASWQVGLGRVVSWTSDGGDRWADGWLSWGGAPAFWSGVVRSVYREPAGSLSVRFDGGGAELSVSFDEPVPDGAQVRAMVTSPGGGSTNVRLDRVDERSYEGRFTTGPMGIYGIGATAEVGGEVVAAVSGTADLGYSREYDSEGPDPELLEVVSTRSGGRGVIPATEAFSRDGLEAGRRTVELRAWLIGLALLAWPVAIALSRLRFASGPDALVTRERLGRAGSAASAVVAARAQRRSTRSVRSASGIPLTPDEQNRTTPPPGGRSGRRRGQSGRADDGAASAEPAGGESGSALDALLEAKRRRRD